MSKYLSIEQVCEVLAIGRDKLRDLERTGELPQPVVIGKTKRWLADELDEFLKARRKQKESV